MEFIKKKKKKKKKKKNLINIYITFFYEYVLILYY